MKRFLVIVFCLFFYSTFAWAETFTSRQLLSDDETFTVDSGDTYYYDGNKVIDAVYQATKEKLAAQIRDLRSKNSDKE